MLCVPSHTRQYYVQWQNVYCQGFLLRLHIIKFDSTFVISLFTLYDLILYRTNQFGWFVVLNPTFNNISVVSLRSVLLVEETRVPGGNHNLLQVADKLYHLELYRVQLAISGIRTDKVLIAANRFVNIKTFYMSQISGAVVVMIIWQLVLQLPMQSVPITTKVVGLNPAHGGVYSI